MKLRVKKGRRAPAGDDGPGPNSPGLAVASTGARGRDQVTGPAPAALSLSPEDLVEQITRTVAWRDLLAGTQRELGPRSNLLSADAVKLRSVAFHESCHAVAFVSLGIGCASAMILTPEEGVRNGWTAALHAKTEDREGARRWVCGLLAGPIADAVFMTLLIAPILHDRPDYSHVVRENGPGRHPAADLAVAIRLRNQFDLDINNELLVAARIVLDPLTMVAIKRCANALIASPTHELWGPRVHENYRDAISRARRSY